MKNKRLDHNIDLGLLYQPMESGKWVDRERDETTEPPADYPILVGVAVLVLLFLAGVLVGAVVV